MRNRSLKVGLAGLATATLLTGSLFAHDGPRPRTRFEVSTRLQGYQEVPALSTTARGKFTAVIDLEANTITWRLNYEALEGNVIQAHVHFGQVGVNGGISFFLCTNAGNGPAGTQLCPAPSGEITGIITPDLVIGPLGQGIEALAFAEIAEAMTSGVAYANVHTSKWPAGEIRGQIR